jgi:hypothetical protein
VNNIFPFLQGTEILKPIYADKRQIMVTLEEVNYD